MNFNLNKREFRDAIKLRYDWEIADLPAMCNFYRNCFLPIVLFIIIIIIIIIPIVIIIVTIIKFWNIRLLKHVCYGNLCVDVRVLMIFYNVPR